MARTTIAHLQRPINATTQQLFNMGPNATRTSYKKDPVSGLYLPGVLLEPQRINVCFRSGEIDHGTWAKVNSSVTNTSTTELPTGVTSSSDVLHEDASAASLHYLQQSNIAVVQNTKYCFSVYARAINRNWIALNINQANGSAYFNLSSGALGTKNAGINNSYIEALGNEWYRCAVEYTAGATGGLHHYVMVAEADNDWTFDGANQDSFYVWGAQVEAGLFPSSYVTTAASAVTRTADSAVAYTLGAEMAGLQWTLLVPVIVPAHTPASDLKLLSVYKNGAAATDHVTLWADTSKQAKVTGAATGKSAGSVVVTGSDICDGEIHWVSVHAEDGQLHCFVDTARFAADLDAGIASDLDRVSIEPSGATIGGLEMRMEFLRSQPRPRQPQLLAA